MKLESNYLSIVFILVVTTLLTTIFASLINSRVENIARAVSRENNDIVECIYSTQYNSSKIVLVNKTCINELLSIIADSGEIYYSNEYVLIKTSAYQVVEIITKEEIIIV